MKRQRSGSSPSSNSNASVTQDIDALYGLEPVFEPAHRAEREPGSPTSFQSIQCPYCGERFDTLVDLGTGSATYIEDCQICCQPIEFELELDSRGELAGLKVSRS